MSISGIKLCPHVMVEAMETVFENFREREAEGEGEETGGYT